MKRHLASLNPKVTIQQAITVIPVAEEDVNTLWCISWLIDHKVSAQQPTKDLVAVLRQLGVATRDEKARNSHLSKWSVKQMVHQGGKELRESEGRQRRAWGNEGIFLRRYADLHPRGWVLRFWVGRGGGTFASIHGQEWLEAVSICFQVDSVSVADVAQRVGFAINAIKKRAIL